jgi:hypothetical protein
MNIITIGLFLSIIITTVDSSGNGLFFFLAHATPDRTNQSVQAPPGSQHVELGDGSLNVITKVNNPFAFGGFTTAANGTRTPEFIPVAGSLTPKDFTYVIANGDPRPYKFPGKSSDTLGIGQMVKLSNGNYGVALESPSKSAYRTDMSPDCSGEIKIMEIKECIVTHTFVGTAKVNVTTKIDNTGGGNASAEDSRFAEEHCSDSSSFAESSIGASEPGKEVTLYPFTMPWNDGGAYCYRISPEPLPGYVSKSDGECKRDIILVGETNKCILSYKFVGKANLKVIHTVENTGGGVAKAEDFGFEIENNGERPYFSSYHSGDLGGKTIELSTGSYHVTEDGVYVPPGYTHSESSGCWGIISVGENKECRITKTFIVP